jgi:hypothetical protein
MSDDVWITVISTVTVALVSIVGIVITQIWGLRSSKASFVFQTRAGFFQEAYRDNYTALTCLDTIIKGSFNKEQVERIQAIVGARSYNLPISFLVAWPKNKDRLVAGEVEDLEKLKRSLKDALTLYSEKYFTEVLGIKSDEIEAWRKATLGNS